MKLKHTLGAALAACALVGGLSVAVAPEAGAVASAGSVWGPDIKRGPTAIEGSCYGDKPIKRVGSLSANYYAEVYYSQVGNGTLCVKFYNNTPRVHDMMAEIREVRTSRDPSTTLFLVRDTEASARHYAGASRMSDMKSGLCVAVKGAVQFRDGKQVVRSAGLFRVINGKIENRC